MLSTERILEVLKNTPSGYIPPNDEFFSKTNKALLTEYKKLGVITNRDEVEAVGDDATVPLIPNSNEIFCNIPGCNLVFNGVAAYQMHFNSVHRYRCSQCRRSLPTSHLLDLHISEQHDSYFAACLERGKAMYRCFLEECKESLATPQDRTDHCIKEHKFPANFRFDQMSNKSKKNFNHKAASRKSREKNESPEEHDDMMKTDDKEEDMIVDAVQNMDPTVSRIKAFSFGQHVEKTFVAKSKKKKDKEMLENLSEIKNALDEVLE